MMTEKRFIVFLARPGYFIFLFFASWEFTTLIIYFAFLDGARDDELLLFKPC